MEQNEFNQLVKKSFEDSPQYKKVFKKVILDNNNHIYLHLINEGVLSLDLKEFKQDISDKGLSYATSCLNDSFKKQLYSFSLIIHYLIITVVIKECQLPFCL